MNFGYDYNDPEKLYKITKTNHNSVEYSLLDNSPSNFDNRGCKKKQSQGLLHAFFKENQII